MLSCIVPRHADINVKCGYTCVVTNRTMNYSIQLNGNYRILSQNNELTKDLYGYIIKKINCNIKNYGKRVFDFHAIQNSDAGYHVIAETFIRPKNIDFLKQDTVSYLFKKYTHIDSNFINTETGVFNYKNCIYEFVAFNLISKNKIYKFTFFAPKNKSKFSDIYNEGISQLITFSTNVNNCIDFNYSIFAHSDTNKFNKYNYDKQISKLNTIFGNKCEVSDPNLIEQRLIFLANYKSFLGENDSAKYYQELRYINAVDASLYRKDCNYTTSHLLSSFISLDQFLALKEINESRLIILNEAHHINIHRDIARYFLIRLKQHDFKYFAVEGLIDEDRLTQDSLPSYSSGYYIQSRSYANLIKEAINLGFKVITYEDTISTKNWEMREKQQAINLFNKTFSIDTASKVFVYCGYDHLRKDTVTNKYFAHYIQKISGINAVSIRQTLYYNHFFPVLDAPCFNELALLSENDFPFIIENKDRIKIDYDIVIPNTSLLIFDSLLQYPLKEKLKNKTYSYLLLFDKYEYEKLGSYAIPLLNKDRTSILTDTTISFDKGYYTVVLLDENYQKTDEFNVELK